MIDSERAKWALSEYLLWLIVYYYCEKQIKIIQKFFIFYNILNSNSASSNHNIKVKLKIRLCMEDYNSYYPYNITKLFRIYFILKWFWGRILNGNAPHSINILIKR